MRWLALPLAAALAWFAFTLTPFWALYDLARAVQGGDAAYVERHVNFRTLRLSLVRQISAAVRAGADARADLEPRERQRINDAAVGLGLALAETMVTPESVIDLLDDGWPQSFDLGRPDPGRPDLGKPDPGKPDPDRPDAGTPAGAAGAGLAIGGAGRLVDYYLAAQMRGFRTTVVAIPPDAPRARQTRIRLRLRGLTWRLVDIEVADQLRDRMAERLARTLARARPSAAQP